MDYSQYPTSRKEAQEKGSPYYFTGKPCKHGHITLRKTKGSCTACIKNETIASYEKRKEYFASYNKSEAGLEAKRKYYERNKEAVIARAAARPLEEKRRHKDKHKKQNVEYYKALTSVRKRRHRNATPSWVTKEQKLAMRKLYLQAQELTKTTGERYVVDHIVPLIGENVSGLHVPWNLRVITQEENLAKSNKHE